MIAWYLSRDGSLCQSLQKKGVARVNVGRAQCQILGRPAARVKVPAAPCVKVPKCQSVKFRPAPGPYYPTPETESQRDERAKRRMGCPPIDDVVHLSAIDARTSQVQRCQVLFHVSKRLARDGRDPGERDGVLLCICAGACSRDSHAESLSGELREVG